MFRLQAAGRVCGGANRFFVGVRRVQRASLGRAGEGYVKGPV
ncbi:MAG: hypothetical protein ACKPJJ_36460 [Planctomycetaceae bacterium]